MYYIQQKYYFCFLEIAKLLLQIQNIHLQQINSLLFKITLMTPDTFLMLHKSEIPSQLLLGWAKNILPFFLEMGVAKANISMKQHVSKHLWIKITTAILPQRTKCCWKPLAVPLLAWKISRRSEVHHRTLLLFRSDIAVWDRTSWGVKGTRGHKENERPPITHVCRGRME